MQIVDLQIFDLPGPPPQIQPMTGPREEVAFHRWYFHHREEISSTIKPRLWALVALAQDITKLGIEAIAWLVKKLAQKFFNYQPMHSFEKREQIIGEFGKCVLLDLTAVCSPDLAKQRGLWIQTKSYTWGMPYEGVRDAKWKFESSQYTWMS